MLTWGEDVKADALREAGWSITAIANHLGRDRKTIRAYLNGERVRSPGSASPPVLMCSLTYLCRAGVGTPPVVLVHVLLARFGVASAAAGVRVERPTDGRP
jgi:predicted transcriptional regulator